jgi:hypothetical protein
MRLHSGVTVVQGSNVTLQLPCEHFGDKNPPLQRGRSFFPNDSSRVNFDSILADGKLLNPIGKLGDGRVQKYFVSFLTPDVHNLEISV